MARPPNFGVHETKTSLVDALWHDKFIGGASHSAIANRQGISKMAVSRYMTGYLPTPDCQDKLAVRMRLHIDHTSHLDPQAQAQLVAWRKSNAYSLEEIAKVFGTEAIVIEGIIVAAGERQTSKTAKRLYAESENSVKVAETAELMQMMDLFESVCDQIESEGIEAAMEPISFYMDRYRKRLRSGLSMELLAEPMEFATYLPDGLQAQFRQNIQSFLNQEIH